MKITICHILISCDGERARGGNKNVLGMRHCTTCLKNTTLEIGRRFVALWLGGAHAALSPWVKIVVDVVGCGADIVDVE